MTDREIVPCNGCVACCRNQRVILRPEEADAGYFIVPNRRGNDGPLQWMLAHKENGDCIYLDDGACSIWNRAPAVCREFDCRKWLAAFTEAQREAILDDGLDADTARAAVARW